jgi:hypothetical protein
MKKLLKLIAPRKETYVEKTPNDVYRDVATELDNFSAEDIAKIGGVESQHGKFNKPIKGGSATGLFQFQPETAEELVPGSSESLEDINTQEELMKKSLKKNNPENVEDAYLAHNLGRTGSKRFISADESEPVENVMSRAVIEANPGLYKGKTVGEARAAIREKLEQGEDTSEIRPSFKELLTGKR